MNFEINEHSRCSCGALTLHITVDNESKIVHFKGSLNAFKEAYREELTNPDYNKQAINKVGCCDYCVNKYGLDLCCCGSGKKYTKCKLHDCCGVPLETI